MSPETWPGTQTRYISYTKGNKRNKKKAVQKDRSLVLWWKSRAADACTDDLPFFSSFIYQHGPTGQISSKLEAQWRRRWGKRRRCDFWMNKQIIEVTGWFTFFPNTLWYHLLKLTFSFPQMQQMLPFSLTQTQQCTPALSVGYLIPHLYGRVDVPKIRKQQHWHQQEYLIMNKITSV